MKITWEASDVKGGIYVCKEGPVKDLPWHATWTFKLGYHCSNRKMCLISMTDGAITKRDIPKVEMAEWLTANKMMPCTHSRLLKVMEYLRR